MKKRNFVKMSNDIQIVKDNVRKNNIYDEKDQNF